MSNITITNGLPADSPWTLANSDAAKLDEANLINLAVGQLALLGASQGQTLQVQTGVLKELIGGVDTVNKQLDFLSNISITPSLWAGTPTVFGFTDDTIGWKPSGIPAFKYLLTPTDVATVEKLITATKTMKSLNINYGGDDGFTYKLIDRGVVFDLFSRSILDIYISHYDVNQVSFPISVVTTQPMVAENILQSGQILKYKQFQKEDEYFIFLSSVDGGPKITKIPIVNFLIPNKDEYFAIPQSQDEIMSWQMQAPGNSAGSSSAQIAIANTAILNSEVVLAPNTLSPTDPPIVPPLTNAVKLSIDVEKNFDAALYSLNDGSKVYANYPPELRISTSPLLSEAQKYLGKIVQIGTSQYLVTTDNFGSFKAIPVVSFQKFINTVTKDQIISWKSQYAEKIIVITQRSSDQQLFVTNLAQKYQYAFDAATYVLKAFTAMLSSAANNV